MTSGANGIAVFCLAAAIWVALVVSAKSKRGPGGGDCGGSDGSSDDASDGGDCGGDGGCD